MASYELLLDDATRVLLAGTATVGRSPVCTVVLDDPTVSRRHARIWLGDDGEPLLEDAGSSFGTFVDGAGVTGPTRLRDGAQIRLGESEMRVAGADLALGGVFALGCLAAPAGATRDVLFQLALAACVGACLNLNPFLDRDGYQILVGPLRARRARA